MVRNSLSLSWQLAVCSFFRNWLGRQRMWKSALWEGKTAWVLSSRDTHISLSYCFCPWFYFSLLSLSSFASAFVSCIVKFCNKQRWCAGSLSESVPQPSGDNRLGLFATRFPPQSYSETTTISLGITIMSVKQRKCMCLCVKRVKHTVFLLQVPLWFCRLRARSQRGPCPWCTITSSCFPPDRMNVTTTSKCLCHAMTRRCSPAAPMPSTPPAVTIR